MAIIVDILKPKRVRFKIASSPIIKPRSSCSDDVLIRKTTDYRATINEGAEKGSLAGGCSVEWNGYNFSRWGIYCRDGTYADSARVGSLSDK